MGFIKYSDNNSDLATVIWKALKSHTNPMLGIELLEFIPWIKDCFIEPLEIRSGYFDFPKNSGAGTTLTEEAMSKYGKKVS